MGINLDGLPGGSRYCAYPGSKMATKAENLVCPHQGERRCIARPRQRPGSRLALNGFGMSYTLTIKGRRFSIHTMTVRNTDARFANSCEVRGKLEFRHIHIEGHNFVKNAWFRFDREPADQVHQSIILNDGDMGGRVNLFVIGEQPNGDQALYTYMQRHLDPGHQAAFPTGDWEITVRIDGGETDKAYARCHVNVGRKNGLTMGILE